MSRIQNKLLSVAAKISKVAANKAYGTTSFWGCCQPKEPAMLKKNSKK